VLPCAIQQWDFIERVEELAARIGSIVADRKKVIGKKSLSAPFWIASFSYTQLMNIMSSVTGSENVIEIMSANSLQLEQPRLVELSLGSSVIFAPYPIGVPEFGQIIALKQKYVDALTILQPIYGGAPGIIPLGILSSGQSKLARFVQELKAKVIFGPPELTLDARQYYPADIPVSDALVRWMDLGAMKRAQRPFGDLLLISGELEGERALPGPVAKQCVMNAPTMEELARLLREDGATNLKRKGQTLTCKFGFAGGDDCTASIEFGETITVTTGSARIESVVLGLIGVVEYPL
jgi:hypothetical protein